MHTIDPADVILGIDEEHIVHKFIPEADLSSLHATDGLYDFVYVHIHREVSRPVYACDFFYHDYWEQDEDLNLLGAHEFD